jgi:hypothetical protein
LKRNAKVMVANALRSEMDALFARFLPADLASRFRGLLAMKPVRWSNIDPWKVWEALDDRLVVEWRETVAKLLATPQFTKHSASLVTVLRCGHERPNLERILLRDALLGPAAVFEGFVSILPGRLGIAINHDGMLCILRHA